MTFDLPFLIAQAAAGGEQSGIGRIIGRPEVFLVLMMVVMYFVMIRPQRNKQKVQDQMQKAMQAGDEVVTIGGAHGTVTSVKEKTVIVRMNEGKIEFDRSAIAQRLPKNAEAVVVADKK